MGTCQEYYFCRDVAIHLVLASRDGGCDEEQDEPRDPHLVKHLEVEDADARIQLNSNEEVVHRRTGEAVRTSTQDSLNVDDDAVDITREDRNSHD